MRAFCKDYWERLRRVPKDWSLYFLLLFIWVVGMDDSLTRKVSVSILVFFVLPLIDWCLERVLPEHPSN